MEEFVYEKQAMKGEPMPFNLNAAEQFYYQALKYLYLSYKAKLMSKEDAKAEKQKLLGEYRALQSKIESLDRENKTLTERIGKATQEYLANKTLETAENLYKAFYNE